MTRHYLTFNFHKTAHFTSVIVFVLVFITSLAQATPIKRLGIPFINNYSKEIYRGSTQNWDLTQAVSGFIYAANNDGLLEFDGQEWNLYKTDNQTVIRSILAVNDTIYTGAFETFGYFARNANGQLAYHSLVDLVPEEDRFFNEIWKIHHTEEGIIFQSFKHLFIYKNGHLKVVDPPTDFSHSYMVDQQLFIVDRQKGLLQYQSGNLKEISDNEIFAKDEIRCILKLDTDSQLIGTISSGVFELKNGVLSKWDNPLNQVFEDYGLFSGLRLSNGYYVFGTIQNGVYIIDHRFKLVQHINRAKGLQNNTILSMFEDRQHNLWLGLDNGIDYLEINSALSIFDHNFHLESVYALAYFQDYLYVGTNQGLFYISYNDLSQSASNAQDFLLMPGTEGQVWSLEVLNDVLFCGHNIGCFTISGKHAEKISDERGFWSFIEMGNRTDTLIAGTYNGLELMVKKNGRWTDAGKIKGFEESSRNIFAGGDNSVWVPHGYRGLYRVWLNSTLSETEKIKTYGAAQGLSADPPYYIHDVQHELLFSNKDGIFVYNPSIDRFDSSAYFNNLFERQVPITKIHAQDAGNIWYFQPKKMGVVRLLEDGSFMNISSPFSKISQLLINSYESILTLDHRNVFIGLENGLAHYDPFFVKQQQLPDEIFFREIVFRADTVIKELFNVTGSQGNDDTAEPMNISYDFNSVLIKFANPVFESPKNTFFSFRLLGFEQNWSDWDNRNYKEYTNLTEGTYTFEVKAKNIHQAESEIYRFHFKITPPFYRSKLAYVFYIIFVIVSVLLNIVYWRRRLSVAKTREKSKHAKELAVQEAAFREMNLLAEKEIINLRNETLQSEVRHKNRELANTAQHLVHKNKILNSIKQQLQNLSKSLTDEGKKQEVEHIIKKINRDIKSEHFQNVFDSYFDDVHQDFVVRLKEKHSNLTPKELRLCAYLRMNLSTKEIAPLMNISIRGIEISRYRLRKKLALERDDNLIEYLIGF